MLARVLHRITDKLEAAEMQHRTQFRGEKLAAIFPTTLDYEFENTLSRTASTAALLLEFPQALVVVHLKMKPGGWTQICGVHHLTRPQVRGCRKIIFTN